MPSFILVFFLYFCLSTGARVPPIIIGHRGAPGYRIENTVPSWEAAINFGSNYIEADLVSTKDHALIASHNPDITHTTNVLDHPEFASRHTVKNISGETYNGFFIDDFTLEELKTLRLREHYSFRDQSWNDLYSLVTLQEFLSFIQSKELELGRRIGIYLETKHSSYYRSIGLPLEEKLVATLRQFGYSSENDPVFIESFESNLKELRKITDLPLVQLISGTEGDLTQYDTNRMWSEFRTEAGLKEIASYAQVVSPHKSCILRTKNGTAIPTSFMHDAHKVGLKVHVWTFRKEREHFEKNEQQLFGEIEDEMRAYFMQNVDGIFTDQPDIGVRVKNEVFHYLI